MLGQGFVAQHWIGLGERAEPGLVDDKADVAENEILQCHSCYQRDPQALQM